jgi:hypothetical protein
VDIAGNGARFMDDERQAQAESWQVTQIFMFLCDERLKVA